MKLFEPVLLPLVIKEQLCMDLLTEFGAEAIRHRPGRDEIIHGCLVSPGAHTDQARNPTASINYETLTYNCLGCQERGGLLWLITTVRECSYAEARDWLAKVTGTGGHVMPLAKILEFFDALYLEHRRAVPPVYAESVLEPWLGGAQGHPYLVGRGIGEENITTLKLGYDTSLNAIVIPHFWRGKLVGWQRRNLGAGPKYVSTEGMPKETTIYNQRPEHDRPLIVESPMSAVRHAHAVPIQATFGASITDQQIAAIMKDHPEGVVFWMDNDPGGWRALEGSQSVPGVIERASRYGTVWVVDSPFSEDPGGLPTEVVQALYEEAVPGSVWSRPQALGCFFCMRGAHEGPCDPVGDEGEEF